MTISAQDVLVGEKSLHADRSTRVNLSRSDADLGAQAKSVAIRESSGAIGEHACRVDRGGKMFADGVILRENPIGVTRTEAIDVVYRLTK